MKILGLVAFAILAGATPSVVSAQAAPPASADSGAKSGYTVADTEIGTLLDDPAAKAILDKHIPQFTANPQVDMARSMTLAGVQQYAPDILTAKALADIQADFNKLPKKK